jgi:hypothetical protein
MISIAAKQPTRDPLQKNKTSGEQYYHGQIQMQQRTSPCGGEAGYN